MTVLITAALALLTGFALGVTAERDRHTCRSIDVTQDVRSVLKPELRVVRGGRR